MTRDPIPPPSAPPPTDLLAWAGGAAPPGGWTELVARAPRYLRRWLVPVLAYLTEAMLSRIYAAHRRLLRSFLYEADEEERWERPRGRWVRRLLGGWRWLLAGDCEDFALELREVMAVFLPGGCLRLGPCWAERGAPHVVLAIDTGTHGTLIADNRRFPAHWRDFEAFGYRFAGGTTEVPGRRRWARTRRAPTVRDLMR